MLFSLSCVVNRCKLDVRTRGLTVLFEIVKTYGDTFKPNWWRDLFNILFRIFDNMKLPEHQTEKAEWMTTTCNHALYAIVDVFTQYFDVLGPLLLRDLYSQLQWCVQQNNEQLARSGTNCLENLVISNGTKFDDDTWEATCNCILEIFRHTLPDDLLSWKPDPNLTPQQQQQQHIMMANNHRHSITENGEIRHGILKRSNSQHSVYSLNSEDGKTELITHPSGLFASLLIKCVVQLELIQTIDNIIFYPATSKKEDAETLAMATADINQSGSISLLSSGDHGECQREEQGMYSFLSTTHLIKFVDCLVDSHRFAKNFNRNHEQRTVLWKAGFKGNLHCLLSSRSGSNRFPSIEGSVKPNLLKQETQSLACVLRILFKMYGDDNRRDDWPEVEKRLISVCKEALEYFLSLQSEPHRDAWTSLLLLVMTRLLKMPDHRVSRRRRKCSVIAQSECFFLCVFQFATHTSSYYSLLCDMMCCEMKPELRSVLRRLFVRIGPVFKIISSATT